MRKVLQAPRKPTRGAGRRRFLALTASGTVGSFLLQLDREARGQAEPTARYVLYNHCNGLTDTHLSKSRVNGFGEFTLNAFMSEFEPYQQELTVLQNMYCSAGSYLHGNGSSALTCTARGAVGNGNGISRTVVGGPSVDQLIADHISADQRVRSLVLSHPIIQANSNCVQGTLLGRAKDEPVFPTLDPLQAHALVFGESNQDKVLVELEQSYLDFIKDDIQSISLNLPQAQAIKLEQYLGSVREIERTISNGALIRGCEVAPAEQFGEVARSNGAGKSHWSDHDPAYWKYMMDLGVAALQCGATRQLSLLHSYGCAHLHYTFNGVKKNHHNTVSHKEQNGPFMNQILQYHAQNVTSLYERLKQIPEGDGTMADGLLITWMSDGGGQHHRGTNMHPMVMLGTAGGRIKSGQWLNFGHREVPLGAAHLTALHAMGLEHDTFGDGSDPVQGPISEVLS